jgi:hypothetical protein
VARSPDGVPCAAACGTGPDAGAVTLWTRNSNRHLQHTVADRQGNFPTLFA